jgi:hypothetical protein
MEPESDHLNDDDDGELTLSAATQAALAEFLAEKEEKEVSLPDDSEGPISIDSFPEDWQVHSPSPPLPCTPPLSPTDTKAQIFCV